MKKIGLLGGAFDPVHKAHIELGASAKRQLNLDEIWLLIDKNPRNKNTQTSFEHRLEMARLAVESHDYFVVDRLAMQREGRTYGVQSLQELQQLHPDHTFTLIAGLDAIAHFDKWESPDVFVKSVVFAVAMRPGHNKELLKNMLIRLGDTAKHFRYSLIVLPKLNISSSQIRLAIHNDNDIDGHMLDRLVVKYIADNDLYKSAEKSN